MKPLVLIPARGGSKGVPGKNIKLLDGVPLIQFTIKEALKVFSRAEVCVSTDDQEILEIAEQAGIKAPFLRPSELATDNAGSQEVMLHALDFYKSQGYNADVLVLLQPTSPFRSYQQILEAFQLYHPELDMVVSVKKTELNPYYVLMEENHEGYLEKIKEANFTRRQDVPKVWELNGAIYVINVNSLKKETIGSFKRIKKYEMDEQSSHDIDTIRDWAIAEWYIEQIKKKKYL